ncbi:MAG: trypsin-like peptidase domain-containing protein, partial [Thermogutta sp.]|uniref:trypsin-like peptidase domain-containing protein n=1 Tax=Thermogutta sp. TaxID=1962930 RepID=UPI00199924D1
MRCVILRPPRHRCLLGVILLGQCLGILPVPSLRADELTGQTVLLDFYADWCGPCQRMMPVVEELHRAGYPVRKVNIDREPGLARRFRVNAVPTFVMIVNGREVDRIVGPASLDQLRLLCRLAPQQPPLSTATHIPAQTTVSTAANACTVSSQSPSSGASLQRRSLPPFDPQCRFAAPTEEDLIAATVRIRIEDSRGRSTGSGTIIDARGGEALIITCGHLFRESKGRLPIQVDLFGPQPVENLPAQLIHYDEKLDIGFLSIRPNQPVVVARVAPPGYPLAVGDAIYSVGCGEGQAPTVWKGRVTAIDKYLGPANIEASRAPVVGRSGGGLFSSEGFLIGVCNAADPPLDEGIYLALREIHRSLDRLNLAMVYRTDGTPVAPATLVQAAPGGPARSTGEPSSRRPSHDGEAPKVANVASETADETQRTSVAGTDSRPAASPELGTRSPEEMTLAAGLPLPIALSRSDNRMSSQQEIKLSDPFSRALARPVSHVASTGAESLTGLSAEERAAWEEIARRRAAGYEIVCV